MSQLATWNITLERQVGTNWVLRAAYVGNKGTYLSTGAHSYRETNPAIYYPGQSTEANTQARRLYQDFSSIGLYSSDNNSHHNALQLAAEKRFAAGFSVLANYTWAKTMDDYNWDNPFSRAFNRGVSDDDIAHTFQVLRNLANSPFCAARGGKQSAQRLGADFDSDLENRLPLRSL